MNAQSVFFIEQWGTRYFPVFYADPRYNWGHLDAITKLLRSLSEGAKLQFFLNPSGSLSGQTPLQAIKRGQLGQVEAAAEKLAQS